MGDLRPRRVVLAECWVAAGIDAPALTRDGLPVARAVKCLVDPLIVRPRLRPDLLRAGWRAPRRVGLIGCASGSDLRYPEPFGLATAAVACGAQTVVASLWTLPTEATLPAGMHPLRELVLATDRALQSADPARTLLDWQLAKARAWFSTGAPADNPAWWAAPALTERAPARAVRVWNARPHHRRNHDH